MIWFKEARHIASHQTADFFARAEGAELYKIRPMLRVLTSGVRTPGYSFLPDAVLTADHVMYLYGRCADDTNDDKPEYLPPGRYHIFAVLNCPPKITSNEITIEVARATGEDLRALNLSEMLPVYAAGDSSIPSTGAKKAFGGKPDEIRSQLNSVRSQCPDSVFAHWLEYWVIDKALSTRDETELAPAVERALEFVENNRNMPLADNLFFKTVRQIGNETFGLGQTTRMIELLDTFQNKFPDSDISPKEIAKIKDRYSR